MNCHEVEQLLDAYVDHELAPGDASAVADHGETCGRCRQRLADRESLGRLVRSAPYYTAPDRLRAAGATNRAPSRFSPRLLAWAAVVTLAVSLGGGALVRTTRARHTAEATNSIAEDVVASHVRALMGDHLVDVRSSDQHSVKPWFLGKLDFSPPVEDFVPARFPLVGGRLDYVAGRPVAALIYQRHEHTINVFVWPAANGGTPIDARSIRGFQVRHWTRDGMSFWAVSDLNDPELAEFARSLEK